MLLEYTSSKLSCIWLQVEVPCINIAELGMMIGSGQVESPQYTWMIDTAGINNFKSDSLAGQTILLSFACGESKLTPVKLEGLVPYNTLIFTAKSAIVTLLNC